MKIFCNSQSAVGILTLGLYHLLGHNTDDDTHIPEFSDILRRELATYKEATGRFKPSPTAPPSPWSAIPTIMSRTYE